MMNKNILAGLVAALAVPSAMALPRDITSSDPYPGQSPYGGGVTAEDNETEPNTVQNQDWDLEAFTLNAGKLGLIAGFDMKSGNVPEVTTPTYITKLGDIWVNLNAKVGASGTLDWDYVIKFAYDVNGVMDGNYAVYANGSATPTLTSSAGINTGSVAHPGFLYQATPALNVLPLFSGTGATYQNNVGDAATATDAAPVGYAGGNHDILGNIDLSWLNGDAYFFTTMGCGNDMIGGHVPDGGTTLMLLGMGIGGLAFVSRRNRK